MYSFPEEHQINPAVARVVNCVKEGFVTYATKSRLSRHRSPQDVKFHILVMNWHAELPGWIDQTTGEIDELNFQSLSIGRPAVGAPGTESNPLPMVPTGPPPTLSDLMMARIARLARRAAERASGAAENQAAQEEQSEGSSSNHSSTDTTSQQPQGDQAQAGTQGAPGAGLTSMALQNLPVPLAPVIAPGHQFPAAGGNPAFMIPAFMNPHSLAHGPGTLAFQYDHLQPFAQPWPAVHNMYAPPPGLAMPNNGHHAPGTGYNFPPPPPPLGPPTFHNQQNAPGNAGNYQQTAFAGFAPPTAHAPAPGTHHAPGMPLSPDFTHGLPLPVSGSYRFPPAYHGYGIPPGADRPTAIARYLGPPGFAPQHHVAVAQQSPTIIVLQDNITNPTPAIQTHTAAAQHHLEAVPQSFGPFPDDSDEDNVNSAVADDSNVHPHAQSSTGQPENAAAAVDDEDDEEVEPYMDDGDDVDADADAASANDTTQ